MNLGLQDFGCCGWTETKDPCIASTLLISAKSSQVQKSIDAQIKVVLNIPQLTLGKLAQLERHETITEQQPNSHGPVSIPDTGNCFAEFIFYWQNCQNDLF